MEKATADWMYLLQTSWGSRADGDTNDAQRLARVPQPSLVMNVPPGNGSLIRYNVRQKGRQTPVGLGDDMPIRVPLLFANVQDHTSLRTSKGF